MWSESALNGPSTSSTHPSSSSAASASSSSSSASCSQRRPFHFRQTKSKSRLSSRARGIKWQQGTSNRAQRHSRKVSPALAAAQRASQRQSEQELRYKACFHKLDIDANKVVTSEELFIALRHILATTSAAEAGVSDRRRSLDWDSLFTAIQAKFKKHASNATQSVDFGEFVRIMEELKNDVRGHHRRALDFFVGREADSYHGFLSSGWKVLPSSFVLGQPDLRRMRLYCGNVLRCRQPAMTLGRFWPNSDVAKLHYLISCEPEARGLVFHFANADHEVFNSFPSLYRGQPGSDPREWFISAESVRVYLRGQGIAWSTEYLLRLLSEQRAWRSRSHTLGIRNQSHSHAASVNFFRQDPSSKGETTVGVEPERTDQPASDRLEQRRSTEQGSVAPEATPQMLNAPENVLPPATALDSFSRVTREEFCFLVDVAMRRVRSIFVPYNAIRAQDISVDKRRGSDEEPSATVTLEIVRCKIVRWGDDVKTRTSATSPSDPALQKTKLQQSEDQLGENNDSEVSDGHVQQNIVGEEYQWDNDSHVLRSLVAQPVLASEEGYQTINSDEMRSLLQCKPVPRRDRTLKPLMTAGDFVLQSQRQHEGRSVEGAVRGTFSGALAAAEGLFTFAAPTVWILTSLVTLMFWKAESKPFLRHALLCSLMIMLVALLIAPTWLVAPLKWCRSKVAERRAIARDAARALRNHSDPNKEEWRDRVDVLKFRVPLLCVGDIVRRLKLASNIHVPNVEDLPSWSAYVPRQCSCRPARPVIQQAILIGQYTMLLASIVSIYNNTDLVESALRKLVEFPVLQSLYTWTCWILSAAAYPLRQLAAGVRAWVEGALSPIFEQVATHVKSWIGPVHTVFQVCP
eukprot:INCI17587.2.p1 GENE.INCI17587.2~~INCI17587.2.p1  ORF type:complete len:860 (-),score=111.09 INCI17587.2:2198-4777(-)